MNNTPAPKNLMRSPALWQGIAIGLVVLFVLTNYVDIDIRRKNSSSATSKATEVTTSESQPATSSVDIQKLTAAVLPADGIELPIDWSDLGSRLVATGVIDREKFDALYAQRGGLSPEVAALLDGSLKGRIRMTQRNAGELLNVLWALGLANGNPILDEGPMQDKRYGGAGGFASTGGWTLAKGNAMDYFSKYALLNLTDEQQALVERVSKGIYRPCCGNSAYFPDCNHGMAMLGLLEVLASQGTTESAMLDIALQANAYWFPSTYLTLAQYEEAQGTAWKDVDAKKMLGANFSSSAGYRNISSKINPVKSQGGGGCGV